MNTKFPSSFYFPHDEIHFKYYLSEFGKYGKKELIITLEDIEATLEYFEFLHENNNEILLNKLNTDFLKIGVNFEIIKSDKVSSFGIVNLETDSLIHIFVTDLFLDIIRDKVKYKELSKPLYNIYNGNRSKLVPFKQINNLEEILKSCNPIEFFSKKENLICLVSQFAKELVNLGLKSLRLDQALLHLEKQLLKHTIFKQYYVNFKIYDKIPKQYLTEEDQINIKTFRRFLRWTYDFILIYSCGLYKENIFDRWIEK